jgi:hypothetical protein
MSAEFVCAQHGTPTKGIYCADPACRKPLAGASWYWAQPECVFDSSGKPVLGDRHPPSTTRAVIGLQRAQEPTRHIRMRRTRNRRVACTVCRRIYVTGKPSAAKFCSTACRNVAKQGSQSTASKEAA